MSRESSHGSKELLNLPVLVLKARHISGSAFCTGIHGRLGTGIVSPRLGLVLKMSLLNFHKIIKALSSIT